MAEIFEFPGAQEMMEKLHLKDALTGLDELVEIGLSQTPLRVKEILSTPLNEFVELTPEEMKLVIFDYFASKFSKRNISCSTDVIQATQYLSDLLLKLGVTMDDETRETLDNPYYTYWLERESPKKAGDASVFNFIFPKTRKNSLSPEEYISFAVNGYYYYFGKGFASGMNKVLPLAHNFTEENPFFRRNFSLVQ